MRRKIDISEVIWRDRCAQVNPGATQEAREEINEHHPAPTDTNTNVNAETNTNTNTNTNANTNTFALWGLE